MKTNATIQQLNEALAKVNKMYDGNISFNDIEQVTRNTTRFTLKAISGLKGSRFSHSGKKLAKASWHVHGHFFDALFEINPGCYVWSGGNKITKEQGNWQDRNIGSQMQPLNFSDTSIEHDVDFEDKSISDKTHYISTDGWRGYEEPINAICGANDTGTWSDSPCPSHVRERELQAIKSLLKQAGIKYREVVTQTSNVFCVHVYLLTRKKYQEQARQIVNDYLENNDTRLLYVVEQAEVKA